MPDQDLARYMDAEHVARLGRDMFYGPIREYSESSLVNPYIPERCIFVLGGTGPAPIPILNAPTKSVREARVSVYIRGNIGTYSATWDQASSVYTAVQRANTTTGVLAEYVSVTSLFSDPVYLGLDGTEHPIFNLDVRMIYETAP